MMKPELMKHTTQRPNNLSGRIAIKTRSLGLSLAVLSVAGFSISNLAACKRNNLASTETVRTGNGENAKFLVPVPVPQEDGSNAYCVYVAGATTDPGYYATIGPGNSANTQVLTATAIPQSEFMQQLRVMPGVGGFGNDIANDVWTTVSAFALSTTALGTASIGFQRGQTLSQTTAASSGTGPATAGGVDLSGRATFLPSSVPVQAQAHVRDIDSAMAQLLEMENAIDGTVGSKLDDMGKILTKNGADEKTVAQFKILMRNSEKGDFGTLMKNLATNGPLTEQFFAAELTKAGLGDKFATTKRAQNLLKAMNEAIKNDTTDFAVLAEDIQILKSTQDEILNNAKSVRSQADNIGRLLNLDPSKLTPGQLGEAILQQRQLITEKIGNAREALKPLANAEAVFGGRAVVLTAETKTYLGALRNAGGTADSISDLSTASRKGARVISGLDDFRVLFSNVLKGNPANVAAESLDSGLQGRLGSTSNALKGFSDNAANTFKNVCFRSATGNKWVMGGKALLCGLGAGATTYGVKKLIWEPTTYHAKLAQVSNALADVSTYQDVNEKTFQAIAVGVSQFQTSMTTKSCQ